MVKTQHLQIRTLWLGGHSRSKHQLSFHFGVDDLRFNASYWYADVDFYALERKYGAAFMERIYFHIAAFTANTLVSLSPERFDPGPYARYCVPSFWKLWKSIVYGVWSQWRYEHNRPDYFGPELAVSSIEPPTNQNLNPVELKQPHVQVLNFCGGGKDSLVSLKLLERSKVPFHTLVYSNSVYGPSSKQHELCNKLLDAAKASKAGRRRIWGYDDLTDSPVLKLHPEFDTKSLTAGETPASIFMALPLVLQYGYPYLCLGHERSADTGNLVWSSTGEEVNHQWGKSLEAEILINEYIKSYLVENCHYFSILKPVYDVLIFNMLNQDLDAVRHTHSCNVDKPWCGKCPKCAYVWINYMAYLPTSLVEKIFADHGNLLDIPENELWFRQMLGLEEHTPFECIGQVEEARLAFELCRRKGINGVAMQMFMREIPPVNVPQLVDRYLQINHSDTLPSLLWESVISQLNAAAKQARSMLST